MAFGRNNQTKPVSTVMSQPAVNSYELRSATGDRYRTGRNGSTEISEVILNPRTRQTIANSQDALINLTKELGQADATRSKAIERRSRDFYDLQAQAINQQADDLLSQTRSDLAKRYGGTYNATFGSDLLARLESNRLAQLYSASKESALLGEDLYQRDDDARIQRFSLFNNYLGDLNSLSSNAASLGSSILAKYQDNALERAKLVQSAVQQAENQRQQRLNSLNNSINSSLRLLSLAF